MDNFILNHLRIIEDFCNSFKVSTYKDLWGIDLNCSVKSHELVWMYKELLYFQELNEEHCGVTVCTFQNFPSGITIQQYCSNTGGTVQFYPINCYGFTNNFNNRRNCT